MIEEQKPQDQNNKDETVNEHQAGDKTIPEIDRKSDVPESGNDELTKTIEENGKTTRLPINISVFTGLLDLLVHLIAKKELDIFSLSLTEITNDYLKTIRKDSCS